jgi:hypothetical protein
MVNRSVCREYTPENRVSYFWFNFDFQPIRRNHQTLDPSRSQGIASISWFELLHWKHWSLINRWVTLWKQCIEIVICDWRVSKNSRVGRDSKINFVISLGHSSFTHYQTSSSLSNILFPLVFRNCPFGNSSFPWVSALACLDDFQKGWWREECYYVKIASIFTQMLYCH